MSARIESIVARRLSIPLTVPYHLSFGDVHAFDTVLVTLRDATGREGYGEATLLTGYTDETIDGSWTSARTLAQTLAGSPAAMVFEHARKLGAAEPFTATAFASAVEMLLATDVLTSRVDRDVELIGTINETSAAAMPAEIDRLVGAGYRTLKIKVGLDGEQDIERVLRAKAHVAGRAKLRIDANQGFDVATARRFAHAVPPDGIELFEQPCGAGDWDAHVDVARDCPLPLMLDESIYDEADIARAIATRAAAFVKVKLMKFVSLARLADAIDAIAAGGVQPVIGNGVASDVGCWMEACVASGRVAAAGEMNGWLKQRRPLVTNPLRVERGRMRIPAGYRPLLDTAALDAATVDRCAFEAPRAFAVS